MSFRRGAARQVELPAVAALIVSVIVAPFVLSGATVQAVDSVECGSFTGPLEVIEQSGNVTFGSLTVTLPADTQFAAQLDSANGTLTICDVATEDFIILKVQPVGLLARSGPSDVLEAVFRSLTLADGTRPFASADLPGSSDIAPPVTGDAGLLP